MIDYSKISDAINFYKSLGYECLDVPWIVSKKAIDTTLPKGAKDLDTDLGHLVGSAEQSFIELALRKEMKIGRFLACTPCFRDDPVDELHKKYFLKVELIDFLGYSPLKSFSDRDKNMSLVLSDAKRFFSRYLDIRELRTDSGIDIVSGAEGIELGSYGIRGTDDFSWVYGTGVAEPRLSFVLNKRPRGYHLSDIPRGVNGEFSKIREEVLELGDALEQNSNVMSLCELSDITGAIELFLENKFPGITLDDLLMMKNITKRAFLSGRRV